MAFSSGSDGRAGRVSCRSAPRRGRLGRRCRRSGRARRARRLPPHRRSRLTQAAVPIVLASSVARTSTCWPRSGVSSAVRQPDDLVHRLRPMHRRRIRRRSRRRGASLGGTIGRLHARAPRAAGTCARRARRPRRRRLPLALGRRRARRARRRRIRGDRRFRHRRARDARVHQHERLARLRRPRPPSVMRPAMSRSCFRQPTAVTLRPSSGRAVVVCAASPAEPAENRGRHTCDRGRGREFEIPMSHKPSFLLLPLSASRRPGEPCWRKHGNHAENTRVLGREKNHPAARWNGRDAESRLNSGRSSGGNSSRRAPVPP